MTRNLVQTLRQGRLAARLRWPSIGLLLLTACSPVEPQPRSAHTARHDVATPCSNCGDALLIAAGALPIEPSAPPVSLTASDGSGLELTRYSASVVVEGPLAFTQLELSFRNPEQRVREGRFTIRLPGDAAISRFAMLGPAGWQEAEVVERKQAQLIYEDFLHRKVDPALMENSAGNEFSARVFPIAAGEEKRLVVSFSSELQGLDDYRLPLAGLPRIEEFSAEVRVLDPGKSPREVRVQERAHQPGSDLIVPLAAGAVALHDGRLALLRVQPDLDSRPASLDNLTVLVDTSASRMLNLKSDAMRLQRLLAGLARTGARDVPLTVLAFDQSVAPIFTGTVRDFSEASAGRLVARQALGASDLAAALSALKGKPHDRVLLISDTIATAGQVGELLARVKGLQLSVGRLDVLSSGGLRDGDMAEQLARNVGRQRGIVAELTDDLSNVGKRLGRQTFDVEASVPGATWVYPPTLEGVQAGESRLLYVALGPVDPARFQLALATDGKRTTRDIRAIETHSPLLRRAAASAQIRRLTAELSNSPKEADALREQIIDLSKRYRVLSNLTALLVLESDADYARYGLHRDALADILTVGPKGVEVMSRAGSPAQLAKGDSPRPRLEQPSPKPRDGAPSGALKMKKASEAPLRMELDAEPAPAAEEAAGAPVAQNQAEPSAMDESKGSGSGQQLREEAPPAPAAAPLPPADLAEAEAPARDDEAARSAAGGMGVGSARASELRRATAARRPTRSSAGHRGRTPPQNFDLPYEPAASSGFDTSGPAAHEGSYAEVRRLLDEQQPQRAVEVAWQWLTEQPGDALALFALGEAYEALGDLEMAARAYGSVIDLFPSRTDLRRFAATRLDQLSRDGHWLAVDSYEKARAQRPDHLTGYRLLAYALTKRGRHAEALDVLLGAFDSDSRIRRAAEGSTVLRHDVGLIAAAWIGKAPNEAAHVQRKIGHVTQVAKQPSLSFVLSWETDANDVDLHVLDGRGGHAFYSARQLPSGGSLLEDVTRGYGPELFAIDGAARGYPYELGVHYYSRGPMGYGMGRVEVVRHDGRGNLQIETRPFVVMNDQAKLSLGNVLDTKSGQKVQISRR